MGRTAPPAGASICINPITFSPVHGTVLAPIYHTERCLLRSTSRANALTIHNFPISVQELSSELKVLTFKLSKQITLQQPVDTTALSRTQHTTALLYAAYSKQQQQDLVRTHAHAYVHTYSSTHLFPSFKEKTTTYSYCSTYVLVCTYLHAPSIMQQEQHHTAVITTGVRTTYSSKQLQHCCLS